MGRKIQFRRGPEAERLQTVLANGEPGWSPEAEQLFIGDGQTLGGVPVAMSHSHIITQDTNAIVGCKYAFKAACQLHLPSVASEGAIIQFCVLSSSNITDSNKAKIIAPTGHTLIKNGEEGTAYHTALFTERTAMFTNSKWEVL
ncbi:hypothetical protein PSECIP111854_02050 [Pseudoalteromonas sp. CIP111854]|uniref:Major tropism determinant N-terminal domain-containing protein n=1 Tax=Pseudoalteromonas holothuriae TaxID=2963714 RepID=A0A9W4QXL7_9GAMM|nr:hypothetical protein [Pseudoalteromonas sp. CIP111854]CAH9057701.1 hypothetical protein PSECIP111854_02050 [Pseudoalteromonas sp. CIP111854]